MATPFVPDFTIEGAGGLFISPSPKILLFIYPVGRSEGYGRRGSSGDERAGFLEEESESRK
jgi:hypothetical protein